MSYLFRRRNAKSFFRILLHSIIHENNVSQERSSYKDHRPGRQLLGSSVRPSGFFAVWYLALEENLMPLVGSASGFIPAIPALDAYRFPLV